MNSACLVRTARPRPEAVLIDTTPLTMPLGALGPLEIQLVRRTADEPLFHSLMEQFHYLRYEQPEAVNLIYGLLIYAIFEYIVWYHHNRQWRGLLWTLALFVGTTLTIYLSVMLFGYYLNPAMVSLLAVLIRLADLVLWPSEAANMRAHA